VPISDIIQLVLYMLLKLAAFKVKVTSTTGLPPLRCRKMGRFNRGGGEMGRDIPLLIRMGRGIPLLIRLGGLGERRKLPQWGSRTTDVNIGNRTSVKSGDIRHIEHRIAIWHRYRFGGRRHLAARRVNYSACLLTLGSAIIVQPWHTACLHGVTRCAFDLRARYPEIFRISTPACVASDDGMSESEEEYVRGTRVDNAVKLGCHSASLSW